MRWPVLIPPSDDQDLPEGFLKVQGSTKKQDRGGGGQTNTHVSSPCCDRDIPVVPEGEEATMMGRTAAEKRSQRGCRTRGRLRREGGSPRAGDPARTGGRRPARGNTQTSRRRLARWYSVPLCAGHRAAARLGDGYGDHGD